MSDTSQKSREQRAINLQAEHGVAVVVGVSFIPSTLFIGVGGDITVTTAGGETGVVYKNLPSGSFFPILVTAVTAATATDIVRNY